MARAVLFVLGLVWACCTASVVRADAGSRLPDDSTHEGQEVPPALTPDQAAHLARFQEPNLTPEQVAAVLARYRFVDPDHVIPKGLLDRALVYFDANQAEITNKRYLSVIDFGSRSRLPRFHLIDMTTGSVLSLHVAHGKNSDPTDSGLATRFGNEPNSLMSSLGYYLTAETYTGSHGLSLRLDGLSPTNSNARIRAVVIHGADYVEDVNVKPGRSWGCPAVSTANHVRVVNSLKNGSIIFAFVAN
ncbi:MAG: murein L,D-transpeptidase catalytic domain family protein [Candidatus Riflebacteria bacterium]|nr:murein L,D-transpeptidase catalytic domain family protein [Candidatus Riflebacteria bacterium]